MNILSISFSQVPCFLTVSFPMYLFQACLKNWYPFVYLLYLRLPLISHHLYFKTCKKSAFITALFQSGLHLAASLCLGQEESWPFTSHATDSHPERKQLIISWQFLSLYNTMCGPNSVHSWNTDAQRRQKCCCQIGTFGGNFQIPKIYQADWMVLSVSSMPYKVESEGLHCLYRSWSEAEQEWSNNACNSTNSL